MKVPEALFDTFLPSCHHKLSSGVLVFQNIQSVTNSTDGSSYALLA